MFFYHIITTWSRYKNSLDLYHDFTSIVDCSINHAITVDCCPVCSRCWIKLYVFQQKCHVKNKDIRKFLDGIYVSDKGAINEEQWASLSA